MRAYFTMRGAARWYRSDVTTVRRLMQCGWLVGERSWRTFGQWRFSREAVTACWKRCVDEAHAQLAQQERLKG